MCGFFSALLAFNPREAAHTPPALRRAIDVLYAVMPFTHPRMSSVTVRGAPRSAGPHLATGRNLAPLLLALLGLSLCAGRARAQAPVSGVRAGAGIRLSLDD